MTVTTEPEEVPPEPDAPAPGSGLPADTASAQAQYAAPAEAPILSPEEQAAEEQAADERAAEEKARRRRLFARTASLAVPGVLLVALLAGTGVEFASLSSKNTAASTAAKSANVVSGMASQLTVADSAAQESILVDPGCLAAESQTSDDLVSKLSADNEAMSKAVNGGSVDAFVSAVRQGIDDEQGIVTDLQQDAALSSRANVKSTIGSFIGDLHEIITDEQSLIGPGLTESRVDTLVGNLDSSISRAQTDGTAVDNLCGGGALEGEGSSSSGSA